MQVSSGTLLAGHCGGRPWVELPWVAALRRVVMPMGLRTQWVRAQTAHRRMCRRANRAGLSPRRRHKYAPRAGLRPLLRPATEEARGAGGGVGRRPPAAACTAAARLCRAGASGARRRAGHGTPVTAAAGRAAGCRRDRDRLLAAAVAAAGVV
ncbi:MAG: hypothetical protein J3K34DRAFT_398777 [Monoraphidium minutum]|nr:MAG: hypothetical protein J3K34DRAFT_398777 [Monoraphidium minutum]